MIIELAGYAASNVFGLYQYENPGVKATVFTGADNQGAKATIEFFDSGDVSVTVGLNTITYPHFGNAFGFYLITGGNNTFYSEDNLNPGGNPQALIFQGDNSTTVQLPGNPSTTLFSSDDWIIAWEDLVYDTSGQYKTSDNDFQDMVLMVQSIAPVPECTTIIIWTTFGVLGVAVGYWRRKRLRITQSPTESE